MHILEKISGKAGEMSIWLCSDMNQYTTAELGRITNRSIQNVVARIRQMGMTNPEMLKYFVSFDYGTEKPEKLIAVDSCNGGAIYQCPKGLWYSAPTLGKLTFQTAYQVRKLIAELGYQHPLVLNPPPPVEVVIVKPVVVDEWVAPKKVEPPPARTGFNRTLDCWRDHIECTQYGPICFDQMLAHAEAGLDFKKPHGDCWTAPDEGGRLQAIDTAMPSFNFSFM